MQTISIILDIAGTIAAMPSEPGIPGFKLRQRISCLNLLRGATNGLGLIVTNPTMEKVNLCVELVFTLANFGVSQAVYYYEYDEKWADEDNETITLYVIGNGLNALAGIGSFTANMSMLKAPYTNAIGSRS